MKKIKIITRFLIVVFFIGGCNDTSNMKYIKGNLKNLPDGKFILHQIYPPVTIDSTNSHNGIFSFSVSSKLFPEPTMVTIDHYDKKGVKRIFSFITNLKYKGDSLRLSTFLLEDTINIVGTLKEGITVGFIGQMPVKSVHPDQPIQTGRQTNVMYNDTNNFQTITKISKLKELINKCPYSYHYLYILKERVSAFTNKQFFFLFNSFDKQVRESKTGRGLREYVENRNTKKLDFTTALVDRNAQKQAILDKNASVNMVILWASWCGPCRKEIPQLKKIYQQFIHNPNFSMVSVSVDEKVEDWHQALEKEKMPWRQLMITPEANTYSKELFSYDGSIPTTLFIDKSGKTMRKFVGYDEKNIKEFMALINNNINAQ